MTDDARVLQQSLDVVGSEARDSLSVEDILFTVCTHEHIHRGEVLAALWMQDVPPPVADYPELLTPLRCPAKCSRF